MARDQLWPQASRTTSAVVGCLLLASQLVGGTAARAATPTLDELVAARRAIEMVYWRHRIWPESNPGTKPAFDETLPEGMLARRVEDDLRKSSALAVRWRRPISAAELQAELDRMARSTKKPDMLRELFAALHDDPSLIAECLARPILADHLLRSAYEREAAGQPGVAPSFNEWWSEHSTDFAMDLAGSDGRFSLPAVDATICTDDTWTRVLPGALEPRQKHTAVFTGSEMIVWGGRDAIGENGTGWRYAPGTDTWTPLGAGPGSPSAREGHTAVWAGTRMIVWGGRRGSTFLDNGGVYDPSTDAWTATGAGADRPSARAGHTAVWPGRRE